MLQPDGDILVLYNPCAQNKNPEVTQISFYSVVSPVIADEDDTLLWQVSHTEESNLGTFVIGETPLGFREIVTYAGLHGSSHFGVVISSVKRQYEAAISFDLQDLHSEQVLSAARRKYDSTQEYLELDTCR